MYYKKLTNELGIHVYLGKFINIANFSTFAFVMQCGKTTNEFGMPKFTNL